MGTKQIKVHVAMEFRLNIDINAELEYACVKKIVEEKTVLQSPVPS